MSLYSIIRAPSSQLPLKLFLALQLLQLVNRGKDPQLGRMQPRNQRKISGKRRGKQSKGSADRNLTPMPIVKRFKRPLNSFIAYRSYYSSMFSALQQKEISGLLNRLWQAGPFKAKWTILAKAYSVHQKQLWQSWFPSGLLP
ncbi:MAG: hypothetical protein M1823_003821 [Watsoniomyces obsoletus]|nr:MAG: hypothetical protein M1823_003821 [Watsoniomyces obsoletus]